MEHYNKTTIQRKRALVENHICAGNQEPSAEAIAGCKQQLDEAKAPPNKTSSTRKPEKALILEPRALAFHLKTSKQGLSTYMSLWLRDLFAGGSPACHAEMAVLDLLDVC